VTTSAFVQTATNQSLSPLSKIGIFTFYKKGGEKRTHKRKPGRIIRRNVSDISRDCFRRIS